MLEWQRFQPVVHQKLMKLNEICNISVYACSAVLWYRFSARILEPTFLQTLRQFVKCFWGKMVALKETPLIGAEHVLLCKVFHEKAFRWKALRAIVVTNAKSRDSSDKGEKKNNATILNELPELNHFIISYTKMFPNKLYKVRNKRSSSIDSKTSKVQRNEMLARGVAVTSRNLQRK